MNLLKSGEKSEKSLLQYDKLDCYAGVIGTVCISRVILRLMIVPLNTIFSVSDLTNSPSNDIPEPLSSGETTMPPIVTVPIPGMV